MSEETTTYEEPVAIVQCMRCLDAVPLVATLEINTSTGALVNKIVVGKHCDWFWSVAPNGKIVARNLHRPVRLEIDYDIPTEGEKALWRRATRTLRLLQDGDSS